MQPSSECMGRQEDNSLTPSEIENLLKKTGVPIYDNTIGLTFIIINETKAVEMAMNGVMR